MEEATRIFLFGIILTTVGISVATTEILQGAANTSSSEKDVSPTTEAIPSSTALSVTSSNETDRMARARLGLLASSDPPHVHIGDKNTSLELVQANSSSSSPGGLDDVSMDDDEEGAMVAGSPMGDCVASGGARYVHGQHWDVGCQERCTCTAGRIVCTQRCEAPLRTRAEASLVVAADPMCSIKPTDDCCALLQCSNHEERSVPPTPPPSPTGSLSCTFENKTHAIGASFKSVCDICECSPDGRVTCKPRCPAPQMPETQQKCLKVPDSHDPCCTLIVCDVEDVEGTGGMYDPATMLYGEATSQSGYPQADARALNATAAAISLPGGAPLPENASVETSPDGHLWSHLDAPNGVVAGLRPGRTYFIRLLVDDVPSPAVEVTLPEDSEMTGNGTSANASSVVEGNCIYKNNKHAIGTQFHDGCTALCECTKDGVDCAPIDCPTNFGLDILDPNCVDWETLPRNFKPNPPHCCPEKVVCRSNGTCIFANESYPNYSDIPVEVTGCEQQCYCENGNVTCNPVCPIVSTHPPVMSDCPVTPILTVPPDHCCRVWMCPSQNTNQSQGHDPLLPLAPTPVPISTTPQPSTSTSTSARPLTPGAPDLSMPYLGPYAPPPERPEGSTSTTTTQRPTKSPSTSPPQVLPTQSPTSFPSTADSSPSTTNAVPSFAPTVDPLRPTPDKPKTHKPHTYFIGPFRINEDDDKDPSDPDFIPGPFNPKDFAQPNETHAPNKIPLPPTPSIAEEHGSKHEVKPSRPPTEGPPPFIYQQPAQPQVPVYVPGQHQQPNVYHPDTHQYPTHPEYQLVHINNQGYPEPYPNQPPQVGVPGQKTPVGSTHPLSNQELYRLQHGQAPPDSDQEVYYVHDIPNSTPSSPQDVYHIVPHSPSIPIEQIIAHIRQQEQQSKQQQKPLLMQPDDYLQVHVNKQGRPIPVPAAVPAPIRPQVIPSYPGPPPNLPGPYGHGHGQGLGDEDDLSTETSRHPAPHQQLSNHSYTGLPPIEHRPPFLPPGNLPQGFPPPGEYPSNHHDEVEVLKTEPTDTSIRLMFAVPDVLVGLHGRVEVRYTSEIGNNDQNTWERQILAPPKDLISTSELEFELNSLHPDTTYNIRISVTLRNLHNTPSSRVVTVRTLPRAEPPTTLPPQIPIDPDLTVIQVNSTWARLTWRKASPFELQFIDGVQLRYKEFDGKVYAATPLIHRAVTSYTLDGLRPDTKYVAGIVFVPFAEQTTELQSPQTVTFTTGIENDPYKFDLNLAVNHIKSTSVELNWTGVPYPEDKFVNIFRAIYQSDAGKEDFSSFKVAKRDSPPRTIIQDLKPGTRYRLWLEAYLTNGRIKKSNVQDFLTKPGTVPAPGASTQGKLEGAPLSEQSDYYGALVAVTVLAILGGIVSLTLLLILFKRCNQNKAAISTCRKSQSAYDNPSYKTCEGELPTNGHANKTQRQVPSEEAYAQD